MFFSLELRDVLTSDRRHYVSPVNCWFAHSATTLVSFCFDEFSLNFSEWSITHFNEERSMFSAISHFTTLITLFLIPLCAQSANSSMKTVNSLASRAERRRKKRDEKDFNRNKQNFLMLFSCCCCCHESSTPRVVAAIFFVCLSNLWIALAGFESEREKCLQRRNSNEMSIRWCVYVKGATVSSPGFVSLEFVIWRCWITDLNVKYFYCLCVTRRRWFSFSFTQYRHTQYWPRGKFDTAKREKRPSNQKIFAYFPSNNKERTMARPKRVLHMVWWKIVIEWEFVRYYVKNGMHK